MLRAAHVDRLVELAQHWLGNLVAAADHAHADVVVHDRRALFDHVLLEQVHQEVDSRLRPLPVLARQAIERELLDLQPGALLGRAADGGDAAAVAGDARQILPLGPAAVAVHDDRDVPRPASRGTRRDSVRDGRWSTAMRRSLRNPVDRLASTTRWRQSFGRVPGRPRPSRSAGRRARSMRSR